MASEARSFRNTFSVNLVLNLAEVFFLLICLQAFLMVPLSAAVIAEDANKSQSTVDPFHTSVCEHFNKSSCLTDGTDCSGTDECHQTTLNRYARCFVLWTNSSEGKVDVLMKGCMHGDVSCKDETRCVSRNSPNEITEDRPSIYCCCLSDMCNREFSWEPPSDPIHEPATDDNSNNVALMVCGILGSLSVITGLSLGLFYCYRRSKLHQPYFLPLPGSGAPSDCTRPTINGSLPGSLSQHTEVSTLCPSVQRQVELVTLKAKGRFGALWMAKCNNDHVAVKIFPASDFESWHIEKEVYGLPQFRHVNVLEFIGVEKHGETIPQSEFWLITAYHANGSLSDYLKTNVVTWGQACRIAQSIAQGLCFLHEELPATALETGKPVIAHRDFKSKNVLLKSDLTACIADFGLAIVFYQGQSPGDTHGQVGTRRYMAPEVLEGAISFQADAFLRIDMYACGLVMWELMSRCCDQEGDVGEYKLPFEEEVGCHPTLQDMQECVVEQKCRPAIKPNWYNHKGMAEVLTTMEECWDHDPEARLTAACVVERLSHFDVDAVQHPERALQYSTNNFLHNNSGTKNSPSNIHNILRCNYSFNQYSGSTGSSSSGSGTGSNSSGTTSNYSGTTSNCSGTNSTGSRFSPQDALSTRIPNMSSTANVVLPAVNVPVAPSRFIQSSLSPASSNLSQRQPLIAESQQESQSSGDFPQVNIKPAITLIQPPI